jgi:hypothetical protein
MNLVVAGTPACKPTRRRPCNRERALPTSCKRSELPRKPLMYSSLSEIISPPPERHVQAAANKPYSPSSTCEANTRKIPGTWQASSTGNPYSHRLCMAQTIELGYRCEQHESRRGLRGSQCRQWGHLSCITHEIQNAVQAWHKSGWTPMRRFATLADVDNAVMLLCLERTHSLKHVECVCNG